MNYTQPTLYTKHISTRLDKTLGYVYFIDREHPLSSKGGKVYYHRHVYSVKIGEWIHRTLQVHHIDGNKTNNDPSNLSAVSPRMHGREHAKNNGNNIKKVCKCKLCSKKFISIADSKFCSTSCASSHRYCNLNNIISRGELEELVWKMPTTHIAKFFGCSDVAISKLCKRLNVIKPPRGHWAKVYSSPAGGTNKTKHNENRTNNDRADANR